MVSYQLKSGGGFCLGAYRGDMLGCLLILIKNLDGRCYCDSTIEANKNDLEKKLADCMYFMFWVSVYNDVCVYNDDIGNTR